MNEREKAETITNAFFASLPVWNITELNGYEPQTTFWMDFSIADKFGKEAVQDTYNRAFADWKSNVVYLTEMVLVLNHKIWQHYTHNDEKTRSFCRAATSRIIAIASRPSKSACHRATSSRCARHAIRCQNNTTPSYNC